MQRLKVSGAVRPIYGSLGIKRLINPHAKKSNGVKSGDLGGQAVGPPFPTQRPGKVSSRNLITPHMLINTWQELEYRLDICRATTGAHIEVYGRA